MYHIKLLAVLCFLFIYKLNSFNGGVYIVQIVDLTEFYSSKIISIRIQLTTLCRDFDQQHGNHVCTKGLCFGHVGLEKQRRVSHSSLSDICNYYNERTLTAVAMGLFNPINIYKFFTAFYSNCFNMNYWSKIMLKLL